MVSTTPRHREIKEFRARKICKDLEIPPPRACLRVIPLLVVAAVLHEMAGLALTTSSLFRRRAAGPPSGGA